MMTPHAASIERDSARRLSNEALGAAIAVLNQHGFDISAPWDGDLDDRERERFEAVESAVIAAMAVA